MIIESTELKKIVEITLSIILKYLIRYESIIAIRIILFLSYRNIASFQSVINMSLLLKVILS